MINILNKIIGHFKTICAHKIEVCRNCFKMGLYWQGLTHDLSKFNPVEFIPGVKYYQGGKRSPIEAEKENRGYSSAWLHHKAVNKHHFWYWVDYSGKQVQSPIQIPLKYVYEMIADTVAAGKIYSRNAGKEWDQKDPYLYYKMHNREAENGIEFMDSATKTVLDIIYVDIKELGFDRVAKKIKKGYYNQYYNSKIISWKSNYEKIVKEYY